MYPFPLSIWDGDVSPCVREAGEVEAGLAARAVTFDPDSTFDAWGEAW